MEQFPFAVDEQEDVKRVPIQQSLPNDDGSVLVIPEQEGGATEFAYINVTDEDEVDIWMEDTSPITGGQTASSSSNEERKSQDDVLSLLWTAAQTTGAESLVVLTEKGHEASKHAVAAQAKGNLKRALEKHGEAAQYFLEAAQRVRKNHDATMTQPLLLLSQSEAEAATSLQRILQLPQTLRKVIARKHKPEADLSASTFLRSAPNGPQLSVVPPEVQQNNNTATINPMEEMLELERELRDMDMALAVSSSITSLDARSRRSVSVADSFMVVPPSPIPKQIRTTTKRPREKQQQPATEDWYTASQILVAPAAAPAGGAGASPKQVMQLMDTIRTVGNENAALLRRVEQAEADRQAAIAARAAMERFQQDYARRFAALKQHLPQHAAGGAAVLDSSTKHQEELIRKLTAELKREKDENRRKNAAIKKYEDFYKAVRARSAEKKKQQQVQGQQNRKVAEVHSGSSKW